MLRSMYSGISGMKVNQTKLDVIGNNISNVGTTGFKSSRARFSDMLNQNASDAMAPSQNKGGVNASQVGLGVKLASIDAVMTQGNMQSTGRALDLAIDGDGFFMVSKGPSITGNVLEVNHRAGTHTITEQSLSNSGSELMYSRDGSFILDNEGNLLTGDGYRILGYSLTNDDSSMTATSQNPTNVSTAGLDFRFGPGSQLNGYKVVLGAVGPQTTTSADVDKASKLIILNGDFSTPGSLTTAQVESAINKGLSANGISQSVYVSGNPVNISDLGSESVKGGADATAPNAISFAGFTMQLSEGSALNGYTLEIRKVSSDVLTATMDEGNKRIVIDGDFITKGAITGEGLKNAINDALATAGVEQTVKSVTGSPMNLAQIYAQTDSGKKAKVPEMKYYEGTKDSVKTDLGGLTFTPNATGVLDGYKIQFADENTGNLNVKIDSVDKTITIHGEQKNITQDALNTALKNAISGVPSLKGAEIKVTGTFNNDRTVSLAFSGGQTSAAPKNINLGGFDITFPDAGTEDSPFAEYEFVIVDVTENDLTVKIDKDKKRFEISGDFTTPNKVTAKALEEKINSAIQLEDQKVPTNNSPFNSKLKVSGQSKVYTGLSSSMVDGGEDLKAAGSIQVGGMTFEPTSGAALNGYKINIGTITSGTKTSASIDEKNKTITINGDFVSGTVTTREIQNVLNRALQDKGINQGLSVTGNPLTLSGVESEETLGGTPVQSINEDGTINFIDGTKDLKAYDGNLKTLKIPDTVRIPGEDTDLRVKTYTISANGVINGVLEDGRVAALGQIAMASFKNPEGLTKLGGNLYSTSVNSGDAIIKSGVGTLGEDNSKGYGDNLQGMLEMSNVDLAEQFTDMIVSSRAFQASSKTITTGDEILQDIINLKR